MAIILDLEAFVSVTPTTQSLATLKTRIAGRAADAVSTKSFTSLGLDGPGAVISGDWGRRPSQAREAR